MIPRVHLRYVQGLASVHEEFRQPRDVDLTTDGEMLVVASRASGRPLVKVSLEAVEHVAAEPGERLVAARNRELADLREAEPVLVVRVRADRGEQRRRRGALVLPRPTTDLGRIPAVQRPHSRTRVQMAGWAGEHRSSVLYAVGWWRLGPGAGDTRRVFLIFATPKPRRRFFLNGRRWRLRHLSRQLIMFGADPC
jgi:hypothetical protein